jgi:hypothetical protein
MEDDVILAELLTEEKLRLLSVLAFELLQASPRVDAWPLLDLMTRLQQIPGEPQDTTRAASLIAELVRDGILVRDAGDGSPLRFLHLTFQEYLAASALAQRYDWAQIVTHWLEGFWESRAPVIELLAGTLPDATPLIDLLLAYDDLRPLRAIAHEELLQPQRASNPFGNILVLAAQCEGESRTIARAAVQDLCKRAEKRLQGELQWDRAHQAFACLTRQQREPSALPVAALHDKDVRVRADAARALGQLGDPRAVEPLFTALHDKDSSASDRQAVASALEKIERWIWVENDRLQ